MKTRAEFRIANLGPRAESTRADLPFAVLEGADVVVRCPLDDSHTLNDKVVWLWGLLQHERRKLKTLQANGAALSCVCTVPRGPVELRPNAAEFLHLCGATLLVAVD